MSRPCPHHLHTPAMYVKIAASRRKRLDGEILRMHADYERGLSLSQIGRIYGRNRKSVRELFVKRGLAVRVPTTNNPKRADGTFAPCHKHSAGEIEEIMGGMTRVCVPPVLTHEWRLWPLARRVDFIARVRGRLQLATDRPETAFSPEVEPFDYGSKPAWAIVKALNKGRNSRDKVASLKPGSQGVIWRGTLWFWSSKYGYQRSGPWTEAQGRPAVHRVIWEELHGCKVPLSHVVRHADGNRNNFAPSNLVLATRNDVARENQAGALARKSRALTQLLLERNERKDETKDDIISQLKNR